MTDAADDLRFQRMKRRTRWLAAVFEGLGAACFIAVLFHDGFRQPLTGAPSVTLSVLTAFISVASVAFLLWPMTFKQRELSSGRVSLFGILVVLLGSYVWLVLVGFILYPPRLAGWADFLRLMTTLGRSLEGVVAGVLLFGVFTFPIGIGIAWAVAIFGKERPRQDQT